MDLLKSRLMKVSPREKVCRQTDDVFKGRIMAPSLQGEGDDGQNKQQNHGSQSKPVTCTVRDVRKH